MKPTFRIGTGSSLDPGMGVGLSILRGDAHLSPSGKIRNHATDKTDNPYIYGGLDHERRDIFSTVSPTVLPTEVAVVKVCEDLVPQTVDLVEQQVTDGMARLAAEIHAEFIEA